jgi:PAS domain S-box-containing protein
MTTMGEIERFKASFTEDGHYRLLVNSIQDYAIYMLDPSGFITSWNAGAQRFNGYQASEIIGKHFSIFCTEEDRQIGVPTLALSICAQSGGFTNEGWRVRKDGSRYWAHVLINPIRDASGELVGFANVTRDPSKQQSLSNALRHSEDQFKLLVQGATDCAIYMLDLEGRVTSWNLGAERIKGYASNEIIGRHFSLFYSEEDRANGEPARVLAAAAREGQYTTEGWRVRRDGSRFWAHVVTNPIMDADRNVIGFGKTTRDVSAPRAAELALERAREAILQSEKMEAVSQLTGGVVQDFNNILTEVMGRLEIVINQLPEDSDITPLLIVARQTAGRGALVSQRMLAFGRRQVLKPETVDLLPLINGMTDLLQDTLGPDVTIEIDFPPVLEIVLVDANQLKLAILHLATNSAAAMPAGGAVTIAARERNSHLKESGEFGMGRQVCLSFTDSGIGMDEDTLAHATEPFFSTKKVGEGSGLGLTMVNRFVEQSGGMFVLESGKGVGTTVELWFPAAGDILWD